ncbi:hypothetical protein QT969_01005 [Rhodococcus sp. CSLK01-03]|uniref:O-antigen polysaccharide polymerase Wzy n=1 Tax=Rhodococcus indonesiensis TaxID=3055869 RepID=A0ABT7RGU7_9NOCA|nr:hypothetical protein [Rhodococcus indonesiensis]MDM7486856.1 hypothetical protein [Rhodococcus indonesiensis]
MTGPGIELVLVSAALITLVVAAAYIRGVARVFLIAQAVYWALSYVARPLVLLTVQPRPRYADNIADPRLAAIGYDRGIAEVLQPVAFGLWVYTGAVVAYAIWARRHRSAPPRAATGDFVPTLAAVYTLGLLGRAVSYVTGSTGQAGDIQSSNPILGFVAQLATVGAIGLIIFIRPADRRTTLVLLGALLTVELMWTVAVESKTPIMSAAMAVAVRFALHGWTRLRVVYVAVISVVGIGGFGWLQSIKQPDYVRAEVLARDSAYPPSLQPYLSILRRFDLLEAATDGYYMVMRPWMTPLEVAQHGIQSLVPAQLLGTDKLRSGTAWAAEVRGSSMDMSRVSVSLADGNINEGFVVAGYAGVAVGVLFTFVLLLLTVRALLARHIVLVALGLAITASPILFERGFLGSMEVIGKSLQVVVLVWLVDMVVREYRKRTDAAEDSAPQQLGTVVGVRTKGWNNGTE